MTPNKKTMSTPDSPHFPLPTAGVVDTTKRYPSLNFRSTVFDPSGPDPMITIYISYDVPNNTSTHVATNTLVKPTESFKKFSNNIIEAIPFLISHISY